MKGLQLNGVPFTQLRIAYFKMYDMKGERIFLDATDEQILKLLSKECETVVISKIEDVEVLEVITRIPDKRKLDPEELTGVSFEERKEREERATIMRNKYK